MLGLWLALAIVASEPVEPAAEIHLTAERVLHDNKQQISTAEGRAKLVTEDNAVDADRIVYDQQRRIATATGHVIARLTKGGKIAVLADLVTIRFDDQNEVTDVYLYDGKAFSKKDVLIEKFLAADTPEKVKQAGTTQALLSGNHLERHGSNWRVEELALVPCECDFENPSWSITSSSATVDTENDRVSINHPIVRIKNIPVLWLPWLSLPLTDRQTGLLFPKPDYSPLNGFAFEQPVFFTLGRSADLTVTPGFFTGAPIPEPTVLVPKPVQNPTGVAGPRLRTEFRYAPSTRANGRILFGLLYDFRTRRDVENPSVREVGSTRGWRGELSWLHTQDFDLGFGSRVDFNGHSDGDYNRDNTVDVVLSTVTYLRSSATAFHRGTNHSLTLDVGLRQDIQWGYDWLGNGPLLLPNRVVGAFGPGTIQRLPAFTFGWTPDPLGPLRFTLDAEAVRLAPMFSLTGDEGTAAREGAIEAISFANSVNRLFQPSSPFLSQGAPLVTPSGRYVTSGIGNRIWEPGEREARDRLMAKPTLSASVTPFDAFTISGSASWRQLAWAGEASGRSWSRGYLLLGGALETQVARRFGSVRHVIEPRVEVRALPLGYQSSDDFIPYDQVDFAVPNVNRRVQSVVELRQRLYAQSTEILRLEVGQGAELAAPTLDAALVPTLGETFGKLTFRAGWLSGQGALRIDPLSTRLASDGTTSISTGLTRASARLDLDDGRGHGAYGTYENLLMEGTMRSRQPLDLLFLVDRGYSSSTRVQQITFGARWNFGAVSLRYDALVMEQAFPTMTNGLPATRPVLAFSQQVLGVGITPACDCMRLDLNVIHSVPWAGGVAKLVAPSFGFSFSVARFGTIGGR